MRNIDWSQVKEAEGRKRIPPGGYVAGIVKVEDQEDKEYLRIEWEFVDQPYHGYNQKTYENFGYWPTILFQSYKETALPLFKRLITSLERSNPGFQFSNQPSALVGKVVGVILGEEEYQGKSGEIRTRLYVHGVRSVQSIKEGSYDVPSLKKLIPDAMKYGKPYGSGGTSGSSGKPYAVLPDEEDLPF